MKCDKGPLSTIKYHNMEPVTPSEKSNFLRVFILGSEKCNRSNRNTLVVCPDGMRE